MHCGDHVVAIALLFTMIISLREGGVVGYICIEAPARHSFTQHFEGSQEVIAMLIILGSLSLL